MLQTLQLWDYGIPNWGIYSGEGNEIGEEEDRLNGWSGHRPRLKLFQECFVSEWLFLTLINFKIQHINTMAIH